MVADNLESVNKEDVTVKVNSMIKYLDENLPHYPKIEKVTLERFLNATFGDVTNAQILIKKSYDLRMKYENIFITDRDPEADEIQEVFRTCDMLPLPLLREDNTRLIFYRLADTDSNNYDFTNVIKAFFMNADVRFNITDSDRGIAEGEIPIFDMSGFSFRHLSKVKLNVLRAYMKFTQDAAPVRLRGIHVINASPLLDRVMYLLKPFMRSEVAKLLHFHLPGSNTLDEFVSKDLLPTEYGGKAGSISDIKAAWMIKIKNHRDYLMDESKWRVGTELKTCKGSEKNNNRTLDFD